MTELNFAEWILLIKPITLKIEVSEITTFTMSGGTRNDGFK